MQGQPCVAAGCHEQNAIYTCAWCLERAYCCHVHQQYDYVVQGHAHLCKRAYRGVANEKRCSILRARSRRRKAVSMGAATPQHHHAKNSYSDDVYVQAIVVELARGVIARKRTVPTNDVKPAWLRFVYATRIIQSATGETLRFTSPACEVGRQYVIKVMKRTAICVAGAKETAGADTVLALVQATLGGTRERR